MSLNDLASELKKHFGLPFAIEKVIKVFFDELKPLEEKLDCLILGYFKDGQAFLDQARISDSNDAKKIHLHNAYMSFVKAANRLQGAESAEAQFMAGVCLYLCEDKNGANLCFSKTVDICNDFLSNKNKKIMTFLPAAVLSSMIFSPVLPLSLFFHFKDIIQIDKAREVSEAAQKMMSGLAT